ncbi:Smr/MutS family protein [Sphingomonas sp.]|uniref:Smr/MutS family protein n=1 Tax=Sphingomonas sp. TaxID=28214 RepID=UPI0017C25A61|nr:Smr/MutS family protein [Sphingomonas sp.]MBA3512163.1 Smr/MutS family protein [Sphingomonas sp.]
MRSLNPDEAELWARVTATIRPLSRRPAPEAESEPEQPPQVEPRGAAARTARKPPPPQAPPRPGTTLDGTWDRKLQSGSVAPDRVVDLHGHNLDRAWSAIDSALERAIESGERVILLITGHSRPGDPPVQRGRIRAAVHDWLAASRHAAKIAAVRPAHGRHGGGGSLYIILRRK